MDDPVAAAGAARDAIDIAVRCGRRARAAGSVSPTSCIALAATGDWDEADERDQPQPQRAPGRRRRVRHHGARLVRGATRRTGRRRRAARPTARPAGERGRPGLASVATARAFVATARNDHRRGAAVEPHRPGAGRARPLVRRRRRTLGVAAGRPVCPRARRSHRRGGAPRHLRAAASPGSSRRCSAPKRC